MVRGSSWAPNPKRVAWTLCTLATILYALTAFSVVSFLAEDFVNRFGVPERLIQLVIIVVLIVSSDFRFDHHFFGARPVDLSPDMEQKAKILATVYSVGSYVIFLSINILLFAKF